MKAVNEKLKLELHLQNAAQKLLNLDYEAKLIDTKKKLDEQITLVEAIKLQNGPEEIKKIKEKEVKLIQEEMVTEGDTPTKSSQVFIWCDSKNIAHNPS